MSNKSIELELRAEVASGDCDRVYECLSEKGKQTSVTRRLSVMHFGEMGDKKVDIRIRITNGESEIVAKFGDFGSHNRVEIAQPLEYGQFMGLVRLFEPFGFIRKIGERKTTNFDLGENIVGSLVSAGPISYLELELMSDAGEVSTNKASLVRLAKGIGVELLESESQFEELCGRLSDTVDWTLESSPESYFRLEESLKEYKK